MSDNKKTLAEKAATAAAVAAGVVAAAAVIPQDELMKTGLPGIWESIKGIAELNWLRLEEAAKKFRPVAFAWAEKFWFCLKLWTLASVILIVAGIMVKEGSGSNVAHVLVAAGTISISGLGLLLFTLSDGIATILFFKFKVIGGALGTAANLVGFKLPDLTPEEMNERRENLQKFRDKVRLILAGTVVMSFSLLFTMFFPAWSTLGWTLIFWAMVSVAVVAAIHLDMKMGKAVKILFYVTVAMLVGTFVIFMIDRLTGGALGFARFQGWLLALNGSEIFLFILVLIPMGLLLKSAFTKDKDAKDAHRKAAKYLIIGSLILVPFLLYRGTLTWKKVSNKDIEKDAIGKTVDVANQKYLGALREWETPNGARFVSGTASEGAYLAPPSVNVEIEDRPTTPRAKKRPLPPLKAKKYENAADAISDLESLL